MRTSRPVFAALFGALALTATVLAGCGPTGDDAEHVTPTIAAVNPELATNPDVTVVENLQYGHAGGTALLLDACLPKADQNPGEPDTVDSATGQDPAVQAGAARPRPAIIVIHGGGWTSGDKADLAWRAVCQWLASAGYPTFSVDYRLAPAAVFPAAFDDVKTAVRWLREKAQVERFNLDPDRIGALGGSAGGNLAALLGTDGSGSLTAGSRVGAVVDISGPVDLTGVAATDDFIPVQLAYLGCKTEAGCAAARAASAVYHVDPTDPPFLVAHSTTEMIPLAQAERFVTDLRDSGVDTDFVKVKGRLHSLAMLNPELKDRIVAFFDAKLAAPSITVTQ